MTASSSDHLPAVVPPARRPSRAGRNLGAAVAVGAALGAVIIGSLVVERHLFIGVLALSTLVANTISQDGDALIPLLALEHRSALLATVLTTVPALVVGTGLLLLA